MLRFRQPVSQHQGWKGGAKPTLLCAETVGEECTPLGGRRGRFICLYRALAGRLQRSRPHGDYLVVGAQGLRIPGGLRPARRGLVRAARWNSTNLPMEIAPPRARRPATSRPPLAAGRLLHGLRLQLA